MTEKTKEVKIEPRVNTPNARKMSSVQVEERVEGLYVNGVPEQDDVTHLLKNGNNDKYYVIHCPNNSVDYEDDSGGIDPTKLRCDYTDSRLHIGKLGVMQEATIEQFSVFAGDGLTIIKYKLNGLDGTLIMPKGEFSINTDQCNSKNTRRLERLL
jgi:hypothetical protein